MKAWHFLKADRRMEQTDELVEVGKTYRIDGPIELGKNGLHGSVKPLGALKTASGPVVCRVNITGDIVRDEFRLVGRSREVLWMYDASLVLHQFARLCALDVVQRTGNESIDAAVRTEPWVAAWVAVRASVWGSASVKAYEAVRLAPWDPEVWSGTLVTAGSEAMKKQNERLYRMLMAGRTK